jgi:hypothetical protein
MGAQDTGHPDTQGLLKAVPNEEALERTRKERVTPLSFLETKGCGTEQYW